MNERNAAIKRDQDAKALVIELAEREKMCEFRSDVDAAKVKLHTAKLSLSWEERREAVNGLANVVGGDVTLSLFNLLMDEGDSDVLGVLIPALNNRLGNASFTMRNENIAQVNSQVVEAAQNIGSKQWEKRRQIVLLLAKVKTIDCYRLLSIFAVSETDIDVKAALKTTLKTLEDALK